MPDLPLDSFAVQLDRYEREVARRLGSIAAEESRRELEAHLRADYDARIEFGVSPEIARGETLAALGDLDEIRRGETRRGFAWTLFALSFAPAVIWGLVTSLRMWIPTSYALGLLALPLLAAAIVSIRMRRVALAETFLGGTTASALYVVMIVSIWGMPRHGLGDIPLCWLVFTLPILAANLVFGAIARDRFAPQPAHV